MLVSINLMEIRLHNAGRGNKRVWMNTNNEIAEYLGRLPARLRVVFALDCAVHALPRYNLWSEQEGRDWSQPVRLEKAVELVWSVIENNEIRTPELRSEVEQIYELVPDTEQFSDASGIGALDAGLALVEAINCAIFWGDINHALLASDAALVSANSTLGKGEYYQHLSQEELAREAKATTQEFLSEKERQLNVLEKLLNWHSESITREQFHKLVND